MVSLSDQLKSNRSRKSLNYLLHICILHHTYGLLNRLRRVDNQRIDYMAAYENHMLDVQKELYLLREKVQEIATDGYVNLEMKTAAEYHFFDRGIAFNKL